jgi:hypothetical protein
MITKEFTIIISLLAVIVFISGCIQQEQGGEVSSPPAIAVGPIIFTNRTVTTRADAEDIFMEWKQQMWDSQNKVGKPLFEYMIVREYTGPFASGSGGQFTCNFGTIKFVAELPVISDGDDWKIENGKVVIRSCESKVTGEIPAVPENQTPVCPSEDTIWIPAPFYSFWINDEGVIFAPGYACIPFEIQWKESPVYITVGNETDITFIMKPKMDVDNYVFNLSLPSELELVSGSQTLNKNLKGGETIELSWGIKGLKVGIYEIRLRGIFLDAVEEVRIEEEPIGTGIPTE